MDLAATLRPATLQDCQALLEIETRSFTSDRLKPRQVRYLLTQAKASTWVAISEDQIAGYCTVLLPAHPRPARIYSLAVRPAFRGRNLAKALIHQINSETKEKGYTRIRLEVSTTNMAEQGLYAQLGFRPIAQLPEYYEDGENGIRLQLDLG